MESNKSILHLVSYYNQSLLFRTLFLELSKLGFDQKIICPHLVPNSQRTCDSIEIYSKRLWGRWTKLSFSLKIYVHKLYVSSLLNHDKPDLIHAHTLYSDGFVANKIARKHNIPYIITVRGTDTKVFARYLPHLNSHARRVLSDARQIIFLGTASRVELERQLKCTLPDEKVRIIPNGVDQFWLNNRHSKTRVDSEVINVLSVGAVSPRKNHILLIRSINEINKSGAVKRFKLTIVGDDNSQYAKWLKRTADITDVEFTGAIGKEALLDQYRNATIFALLSKIETFGLVYLEALTQGLPILYTKGEGFDGWDTSGKWGYACDITNSEDVKSKLLLLSRQPRSANIESELVSLESTFSWPVVGHKIANVYRERNIIP